MSTATERDAAALAASPGTAGPVPPSRRRHSGRRREGWAAWILALPFCLLFLVFTLWPVAQSLFMSFTDTKAKDLRTPFSVDIIGIDNYTRAFSDETFLHAIRNTAYFVLLGVPLTMTLALAAAVALAVVGAYRFVPRTPDGEAAYQRVVRPAVVAGTGSSS